MFFHFSIYLSVPVSGEVDSSKRQNVSLLSEGIGLDSACSRYWWPISWCPWNLMGVAVDFQLPKSISLCPSSCPVLRNEHLLGAALDPWFSRGVYTLPSSHTARAALGMCCVLFARGILLQVLPVILGLRYWLPSAPFLMTPLFYQHYLCLPSKLLEFESLP